MARPVVDMALEYAVVDGASTSTTVAVTGARSSEGIDTEDTMIGCMVFDTGTSIIKTPTPRISADGYVRIPVGTKGHRVVLWYIDAN